VGENLRLTIQVGQDTDQEGNSLRVAKMFMGGTEPALEQAFKDACDAFAARDPTIGGLLDKYVKVYSVKHQNLHTPRDGATGAIKYFADQFSLDNPKFDPNAYGSPNYNVTGNGMFGTVDGDADWTDNSSAGRPEHIQFFFDFSFDSVNNQWMITRLWSKPK